MRAELFDCVRDDLGSRAHGSSTRSELVARLVELGFEALDELGGALLEVRGNSDAGSFDEEGFLTLVDRIKDMMVCGGINVYPKDIEEVVIQHPEVAEVAKVADDICQ